jgi:LysR family transcriptional activator of mexEF-oprN operon
MEPIDHFNLRTFDLNLLLAFDALMQELSVTRAAARLKIQQPAMSHALANLRMVFNDPLFVRTGHKMEATARAQSLHATIHPILVQAQQALLADRGFEPHSARATFRLGVNPQLEALIVPSLIAHIGRHAPGIRIQSVPLGHQPMSLLLNEDRIDLAVAHSGEHLVRSRRELLYREHYVCCFNPALLAFTLPIALRDFHGATHGVIASSIDVSGFLDHLFKHAAHRPQGVHASYNVMTLLDSAANTPLIASVHARVAARFAPLFGLAVSPLPFAVDDLDIEMMWHERTDHDPALAWLRAQIRTCLSREER